MFSVKLYLDNTGSSSDWQGGPSHTTDFHYFHHRSVSCRGDKQRTPFILDTLFLKAFVISISTVAVCLEGHNYESVKQLLCSGFFLPQKVRVPKELSPSWVFTDSHGTRTIRFKFLISCYLLSVNNEWACLEKGNCSQTSIPAFSFPAVQEIAQNILMSSLFFLDSGCSDFFLRNTISTSD